MSEARGRSLAGRILKGMAVIVFFGLFAKVGGFLMSLFMASFYGPGRVLDGYTEVFNIVIFTFLYSTVLKIFVPAFMPLFAELRNTEGEDGAWRFANTTINLLLIGGVIIVILGVLFAPQVMGVLVPGFDDAGRALAASMMRVMMPGAFVFIFAAAALAVFNSYKIFSFPSAGEATQKLLWAATLFVQIRVLGMAVSVWHETPVVIGFLAGCSAQLAILLWGLRRWLPRYWPFLPALCRRRIVKEAGILLAFAAAFAGWVALLSFAGRHRLFADETAAGLWLGRNAGFLGLTGALALGCGYALLLWWRSRGSAGIMGRFALLAAPMMLGVLFARYRDLTTALFQSHTQTGVFGVLELGKKIGNLPTVLVAYSLSIAMFPHLCDLAARKDTRTFARLLTRTLQTIALFFLPLMVVIICLGRPIFQLVFDRGDWAPMFLDYGGLAVTIYCSALFFYAIENVLMQSFFSIQRMWAPTLIGMGFTIVHALFLFVSIRTLGFDYPHQVFLLVAVSFPLTRTLKNIVLIYLLKKRVAVLPLRQMAAFATRLVIICAGVAAATLGVREFLTPRILPGAFAGRTVMIDTFNAEPRGWFSRNAWALDVREPEIAGFSGRALVVKYAGRESARVGVRRSLGDFDCRRLETVRLRLAARIKEVNESAGGRDLNFRVSLRRRVPSGEEIVADLGAHPVGSQGRVLELQPEALGSTDVDGAALLLVIEDDNPWRDAPGEVVLAIDDVAIVSAGREIVVDSFDPGAPIWQGLDSGGRIEAMPGDSGEVALRVEGGPHRLVRDVSGLELAGARFLSFKAAADAPVKIRVELRGDGTSRDADVEISASRDRRTYRLPLDRMRLGLAGVAGAAGGGERMAAIAFVVPESYAGALWLDNIALEDPPRRLSFELAKIILAGVPAIAGMTAFIVLCLLLRMEEAMAVVAWLRDKVRRKRRASSETDE